jgi:hypothetical protein
MESPSGAVVHQAASSIIFDRYGLKEKCAGLFVVDESKG